MSLKKIVSLLNQNRFAAVFDVPRGGATVQWISNGYALYPLEGLPYIEDRNLPALLSVADKDLRKWRFSHLEDAPAGYCFEDDDAGEKPAREAPITFRIDGNVLKPLLTGDGVIFIKYEYLLPVDSDAAILYERRTPGGERYIAVKEGLFLKALILPYDAFRSDHVTVLLEDMARVCRTTLVKTQWEVKRRDASMAGEDVGQERLDIEEFDVDPDTGEVRE